ncbi:hypothetical protein FQR65_LT03306 [Abscondita terminalis]|nr:hypothetical protein FQR65_LT03306 [Abscondita terminalis]
MYRTLLLLIFVWSNYAAIIFPGVDELRVHPYHESTIVVSNPQEVDSNYWNNQAQSRLADQLARLQNTGRRSKKRNSFLGDGMSIATLSAARAHLGHRNGKTGEEIELSFEKFPYVGLSKTYCVDAQVADSACSATAYLGGVKGNTGTIGVSAAVTTNDCDAMINEANQVLSIAHYAQKNNKRTGVITTTRITHASPAGVYAHVANRWWESDSVVSLFGKDSTKCNDIAHQLVHGETGKNLNVIFGGGRTNFMPFFEFDEDNYMGIRFDGRNLIKEWEDSKKGTKYKYVSNREDFVEISNDTEYVLGLFGGSHMDYNLERDITKQPSLQEMTEKAIELLTNQDEGFFLFVEGGRIDTAHHDSKARKALDETIEFHKAVESAVRMTNEKNTLIVVTSDHSHTMSFGGYADRGADVLGVAGHGLDFLPYTTLNYANGPGYRAEVNGRRHDVSQDNLTDFEYKYPAYAPLFSETHGGDDVAIFARGPWAHLFSGVLEQNFISHAINFASCGGVGATVCDTLN